MGPDDMEQQCIMKQPGQLPSSATIHFRPYAVLTAKVRSPVADLYKLAQVGHLRPDWPLV